MPLFFQFCGKAATCLFRPSDKPEGRLFGPQAGSRKTERRFLTGADLPAGNKSRSIFINKCRGYVTELKRKKGTIGKLNTHKLRAGSRFYGNNSQMLV
jgi:hypothetical protein